MGGEAGEVEVEIGEGVPEVFPSPGQDACLNGFVDVRKRQDL